MADGDRMEREIEEILGRIEDFPGAGARRGRPRGRRAASFSGAVAARQRAVARWLSGIAVSQLMLASFLLILASFFFRRLGPLAMWPLYAGIVLFVVSFAMMTFTRSRPTSTTKWRGQQVSYRPYATPPGRAPEPLSTRLRRWWAARARR